MLAKTTLVPLGFLLAAVSPSLAAEVAELPPTPTWTVGLEGSPEFYAIDNGANTERSLADSYFKISLSHNFDTNFVGGISLQPTFKTGGKTQYFGEAVVGYRLKVADAFSLMPSLALGYTWLDTGIFKGTDSNAKVPYYALYLAGDWKLSRALTWNVFNLRYRNAFNATWETPKVATGLSYNIDSYNTVYVSIGYSWKKLDTTNSPYNDFEGDKINLAIGYKRSF